MKLIFCPHCESVFSLSENIKYCECMKSWGYYTDVRHAVINTHAVPIGFHNSSFLDAVAARPSRGIGSRFEAFVIPHHTEWIDVYEKEESVPKTTSNFEDWKAKRSTR